MNDQSLLREIEEDVRHERWHKFWLRYGNTIIGIALAVVVGVAASKGWHYYTHKQQAESGEQFSQAVGQLVSGNYDEAAAALGKLEQEATDGFAILAGFREAEALNMAGKATEAIAAYTELADRKGIDNALGDLARMQAIRLQLTSGNISDADLKTLEILSLPGRPFAASAQELYALALLSLQRKEEAIQQLRTLASAATTPDSLRDRAENMLESLGESLPAASPISVSVTE